VSRRDEGRHGERAAKIDDVLARIMKSHKRSIAGSADKDAVATVRSNDRIGSSVKILLFVPTGEVELSADPGMLSQLADLLARGAGSIIADLAPDTPLGQTALTRLQVLSTDGQPVTVGADAEERSLVISGDRASLKIFADNVQAMAEVDDDEHLHIDFYPDHPYLGEGSAPLVVSRPQGGMPAARTNHSQA
jgi:hypothetical protein